MTRFQWSMTGVRGLMPSADLVRAVVVRASNVALALGAVLILARAGGAAAYGSYAFALALAGMLATGAGMGLDGLAPRELATSFRTSNWPRFRSFFGWAVRRVTLVSAAAGLVLMVAAAEGTFWPIPAQRLAVVSIAVGVPFFAVLPLWRARLQATGRTAWGLFFQMPLVNSLLVLIGLFMLWGFLNPEAWVMAVAHSGIMVVAVSLAALRANRPRIPTLVVDKPDQAWKMAARPFLLVAVFQFVLQNLDLVVVGSVLNPADTGRYSVASRISMLVVLAAGPLAMVAAPRIAYYWSRRKPDMASRQASHVARITAILSIPVLVMLWVAPGFFLGFFGTEFGGANDALRILVLGQATMVVFGPGQIALSMTHQERQLAWLLAVVVLIGLFGSIALTLRYGIEGAATARFMMLALFGSGAWWIARRNGLRIGAWQRPRASQRD